MGMHGPGTYDPPRTPAGRTRCQHDLLDGECAWCLGQKLDWEKESI